MKKTELEKLKGLRIAGEMERTATPARYGKASVLESRRERRKREQALGLVPFAVKLDAELVKRVRARAEERAASLDDTVAELLTKGLGAR
ncbi:MAG: hypothetical protein WCA09_08000 [Burkholderiales bacterium]